MIKGNVNGDDTYRNKVKDKCDYYACPGRQRRCRFIHMIPW